MPDPVALYISYLESQIRSLQGDLDRVVRERNAQVELTIRLEDQKNALITGRSGLIAGLKHLYEHLSLNGIEYSLKCADIHPFIKEYVK